MHVLDFFPIDVHSIESKLDDTVPENLSDTLNCHNDQVPNPRRPQMEHQRHCADTFARFKGLRLYRAGDETGSEGGRHGEWRCSRSRGGGGACTYPLHERGGDLLPAQRPRRIRRRAAPLIPHHPPSSPARRVPCSGVSARSADASSSVLPTAR